jgi:hypothetical protein
LDDALRALALGQELGLPTLLYSCMSNLGRPIETVYARAGRGLRPERDINGMPIVHVDDWGEVDLTGAVAILFEMRTGCAYQAPRRDSCARTTLSKLAQVRAP